MVIHCAPIEDSDQPAWTRRLICLLGRSYQKDNFLTLHSICPVVSDDTKSQSSAEKMHGTSEKKSSDNEPQHERIDKTGDHRRKKNDSRKMFRIKSEPNSPLCQDALLFITDAEKDFDSAPGDKGSAEQNKNKMKTKKRRTSLHKRASLSVEFKGKILCCLLFLLLFFFFFSSSSSSSSSSFSSASFSSSTSSSSSSSSSSSAFSYVFVFKLMRQQKYPSSSVFFFFFSSSSIYFFSTFETNFL